MISSWKIPSLIFASDILGIVKKNMIWKFKYKVLSLFRENLLHTVLCSSSPCRSAPCGAGFQYVVYVSLHTWDMTDNVRQSNTILHWNKKINFSLFVTILLKLYVLFAVIFDRYSTCKTVEATPVHLILQCKLWNLTGLCFLNLTRFPMKCCYIWWYGLVLGFPLT